MRGSTPTPSTRRRDAGRDGGAKSPRPTVVNVMTAKYAALPKVIPNHHDVTTVTKRMYLRANIECAPLISDAAVGPAVPNQRLDEYVEFRRLRADIVTSNLSVHPRYEREEVIAEDREDKREPGDADDGNITRQCLAG